MIECLILQAEGLYNSAIFVSDGQVLAGRVFSEGKGYQALLVDEEKRIALLIGDKKDESLYGLKECGKSYIAVGHSGRRSLFLIYDRLSGRIRSFVGPEGILWQTNCEYGVGGIKENFWKLLILELRSKRGKALFGGENIYAYSFAKTGQRYVLVGRVGREGNYDSFILWTNNFMNPIKALRSGWRENDYLRYTNGNWAVGRIDIGEDSEGFVVELAGPRGIVYIRQGFDYFRYIGSDGLFIAGEGEDESHTRKSLLVRENYGSLLGEGFSAVRFYDEKLMTAYGYMYKGEKAYAFRLRKPHLEPSFKYSLEQKETKWKSLKLSVDGGLMKFKEQSFSVKKVPYNWLSCKDVP